MRDRGHERVAQPLEAAVGRHFAQRPDAADEGPVGPCNRGRAAAEDAAGLAQLEFVLAGGVIVRELAHPFAEAIRLGRPVREREQALGHGAVRREAELHGDPLERGVREEHAPRGVGETDPVERRVEQRFLYRARRLQLERVGRDPARGEAGGDTHADEWGES